MEELNAVTAAQEPVVAASEPVTEQGEGQVEPVSAPAEQKAVQTHEDNQVAKQARLAAEKATRDAVIAEAFGAQGITTYEQYQQAIAAQKVAEEAENLNVAPEVIERLTKAEQTAQQAFEKLSKYERKEIMDKQAAEMSADPRYGKFFKANESEIRSTADQLNVDLETARLLVLDKKYQEPDIETIKKDAIQEYIESLRKGNKPVEGSGAPPVLVQSEPKTFEEARKGALALLRNLT